MLAIFTKIAFFKEQKLTTNHLDIIEASTGKIPCEV
jgi:hypothetical protein